MGMFSFISNNNKGYRLLFQEKDAGVQICSFNSTTGGGYSQYKIQNKVLQGKVRLIILDVGQYHIEFHSAVNKMTRYHSHVLRNNNLHFLLILQ